MTEPQEMQRIRDEAAAWVIRLADTDAHDSETHTAFAAWRQRDARHGKTYDQICQLWQAVTPQTATPAKPARTGRVASVLVILLGLGLLLAQPPQPVVRWLADEQAAIGEIRRITLADGSVVTLNSGSAINIRLDAMSRRVELVDGDLLADVAHDPAGRPFIVSSADGEARALGTRYLVSRRDSSTRVDVIESQVAVSTHQAPEQVARLQPGQAVRIAHGNLGSITASAIGAGSWTSSRLIFNNASLSDVIAELSRYHRGLLRVRGSAADLRFTGSLPANDSTAAMTLIAGALPVQVKMLSPWLTWIEARPSAADPQASSSGKKSGG